MCLGSSPNMTLRKSKGVLLDGSCWTIVLTEVWQMLELLDLTPAIQLPPYYLTTQYPTRQLHQYHYIVPATSTTAHQQSYFPKTIIEWNSLPSNMYRILQIVWGGKVSRLQDSNVIHWKTFVVGPHSWLQLIIRMKLFHWKSFMVTN